MQPLAATPCYPMRSAPCATATPSLDVYSSIDYKPTPHQVHAHTLFAAMAQPANSAPEGELDPYIGKQVILLIGKNKGKQAFVEKKISKKYKLHIQGVPKPLEYFPKQFALLPTALANMRSMYFS